MDRIEKVRASVDSVLMRLPDAARRRNGYLHLYGVSQACALIALKRGVDAELATIAGMLHDLYTFSATDTKDHAHRGAVMARELLISLECFSNAEIDLICGAIHDHSDKGGAFSAFDETLIDADVLQHCLYNPLFDVAEHEKRRYANLRSEFGF